MASVCGILVVPCLGKGIYESVISCLICLAIGTMLGDAVLHLIPQVNEADCTDGRVVGEFMGMRALSAAR